MLLLDYKAIEKCGELIGVCSMQNNNGYSTVHNKKWYKSMANVNGKVKKTKTWHEIETVQSIKYEKTKNSPYFIMGFFSAPNIVGGRFWVFLSQETSTNNTYPLPIHSIPRLYQPWLIWTDPQCICWCVSQTCLFSRHFLLFETFNFGYTDFGYTVLVWFINNRFVWWRSLSHDVLRFRKPRALPATKFLEKTVRKKREKNESAE